MFSYVGNRFSGKKSENKKELKKRILQCHADGVSWALWI